MTCISRWAFEGHWECLKGVQPPCKEDPDWGPADGSEQEGSEPGVAGGEECRRSRAVGVQKKETTHSFHPQGPEMTMTVKQLASTLIKMFD